MLIVEKDGIRQVAAAAGAGLFFRFVNPIGRASRDKKGTDYEEQSPAELPCNCHGVYRGSSQKDNMLNSIQLDGVRASECEHNTGQSRTKVW